MGTGPTTVTTCRNMRIDALLYQSGGVELVDMRRVPQLSSEHPIPNDHHPSDHVPIAATFRFRTKFEIGRRFAQEWYLGLSGRGTSIPLNLSQLTEAFRFYDRDGTGVISEREFRQALPLVLGPGVVSSAELSEVLPLLPFDLTMEIFVSIYAQARAQWGVPGMEEFMDAFAAFDKDGNQTLELEEFIDVLLMCSPEDACKSEIVRLFSRIDGNADGRIDKSEFVAHLTRVWTARFAQVAPGDILINRA